MSASGKPLVVALEEHYWDPDLLALFPGGEGKRVSDVEKRLLDMGELRLREMDEAGIDVQVLSHGAPGTQKLDAETSIRMARQMQPRVLLNSSPPIRSAFLRSAYCRRPIRRLLRTSLNAPSPSWG